MNFVVCATFIWTKHQYIRCIIRKFGNLSLGTDGFRTGGGSENFGNRENLLGTDAQGIGVTHSQGNIRGVYWDDVASDGIGERTESASSSVTITNQGNPDFALIVGRIQWGASDTADETLTLYAPDTSLALGAEILSSPGGTFTIPALDQSLFDTIAIQFKDNSQVDEIRFGSTSADVLPAAAIPEPSSSLLFGLGALGLLLRRR